MNMPKPSTASVRLYRFLILFAFAIVLTASAVEIGLNLPSSGATAYNVNYPTQLRVKYANLLQSVSDFEGLQSQKHLEVVSDTDLQQRLSDIQLSAASGRFKQSLVDISALRASIDAWRLQITDEVPQIAKIPVATNVQIGSEKFLPILVYHFPPADFDEQLTYLQQHNYTVIDMEAAYRGLEGGPLPAKPVVITFDDGFANQMQAFDILKRHNMHATFYIINGGQQSRWCIGASRRYGDPLQPPQGCGDAYLTWDQVRELDKSGLITIGAHTVDHENLASLSEADQRQQIFDSKAGIEQQLGHEVTQFCYPYGSYNQTTIDLVREAGFTSAVTTLAGNYQDTGSLFTLKRIRDTMSLP